MARKVTGFCSFDGRFFETKEAVTRYETAIKLYETLDDLLGRISLAMGYNAEYLRNHFKEDTIIGAQQALHEYVTEHAETIAAYIKARPDLTSNRDTIRKKRERGTVERPAAGSSEEVTDHSASDDSKQPVVERYTIADNEGDGT